ncbi:MULTISPECIES: molecular chaperone DnaJ [unclassified Frankia]|uniref:molecular chaperone DnaJ n=1 Tax=unclassified Frankia TaxID=2632575 RepID=UPI002AD53816|nr:MULTISPECIES: molecular chaperone DnaJ [unclassified Frankia]
MCNPRRVRVRATRDLTDAWEQEVRRQVTRRGQAVGDARVREPLGSSIGAPTLAALSGVLARTDGWERDGESFRHALDGGYLLYHPATRELEIVAEVAAEVAASAEVATVVRGQLAETVEGEGEGTYYDDNYGGRTETHARRDAERNAARAVDAQVDALLAAARAQADDAEGTAVEAAAAARADAALAQAATARVEALRREAATRLVAVGIQGRNIFHQALAGAYRDAILAYARARRAEGITCSENGGVLDIEFELQI